MRRGWTVCILSPFPVSHSCELSNKSKVPLSKKKRDSHFKHPASGMQLKIISQQMLTPSAATKHHFHHLPSGHTQRSNLQFSCFKCQPAVDYAVCFAIKVASSKNLMHLQCKGYKVLFLKAAHYHNKEQASSVIKQACCHHMIPHTEGHLGTLRWIWNFCNVDWWARTKNLFSYVRTSWRDS